MPKKSVPMSAKVISGRESVAPSDLWALERATYAASEAQAEVSGSVGDLAEAIRDLTSAVESLAEKLSGGKDA